MADGELPLNTPVAAELPASSSPTPAASPVSTTPEAAPASLPTQTPPVSGDAAVTTETPVVAPEVSETVLGEALKPVEAPKPTETPESAEAPKPEGEKKEEGGQSDEPAPLPSYEPFTLPEEVKLEEARLGEFTNLLGEFEGKTKADHAEVQQLGQKLVDFHVTEVKQAVDTLTKYWQTSFERQKTEWKDAVMKDPELGGNRFQTTIDSALTFIRTHGGSEAEQAEFREMLNDYGVGNHPAMVRLLSKAGRAMSEGQPLAALKPVPNAPKSKTEALYGKAS